VAGSIEATQRRCSTGPAARSDRPPAHGATHSHHDRHDRADPPDAALRIPHRPGRR
jgi:hypothetical protein